MFSFYFYYLLIIAFGSYGINSLVKSSARFCNIFIDAPTPHSIEYLNKVWSFAGPAIPICIGKSMPIPEISFAHSITVFESKQNCVAIAILASVLFANSFFQSKALLTFLLDLSGSMSLFPSG